jgi:hypothetical protein
MQHRNVQHRPSRARLLLYSRHFRRGHDPTTGEAVEIQTFDGEGLYATHAVPPAGFNPLTATQAQLSFYGFPERPTEATELAAFNSEFSQANYTGELPASSDPMCLSLGDSAWTMQNALSGSASPDGEVTQDSANWAGIADFEQDDYNYVHARIVQPTASYCPGTPPSAHFYWVGLGGVFATKLLQNGTASGYYNVGGSLSPYAWWQALSPTDNTLPVLVPASDMPVSSGQNMAMATEYWSGSSSHVEFYWHNFATGDVYSITAYSIDGNSVSSYYDGETAEVIDERPTDDSDQLLELRESTPSNWTDAVTSDTGTSGTQDLPTDRRPLQLHHDEQGADADTREHYPRLNDARTHRYLGSLRIGRVAKWLYRRHQRIDARPPVRVVRPSRSSTLE